ncbi:MAG: zf-HC2 domain-containing protein [Elusimicrobiota bacterium]|nr:zf-HC2 domain-containing protein [Elusimicrobiota bacterium]
MLFDPCSNITRKLSAYMDGELGPGGQAVVKKHLAACADCAMELRRLSGVDAGIKELKDITPSPFFVAKVSAAVRALNNDKASLRRFLRLPVPAMALMVTFILINLFTFAFNIQAMESGTRRELARKVVAQLAMPASMINPVALVRLCGECSKYMCLCMHEAGKESMCPCKDCEMGKMQKQGEAGKTGDMGSMEEKDVH